MRLVVGGENGSRIISGICMDRVFQETLLASMKKDENRKSIKILFSANL